jgi:hypothetical protein
MLKESFWCWMAFCSHKWLTFDGPVGFGLGAKVGLNDGD